MTGPTETAVPRLRRPRTLAVLTVLALTVVALVVLSVTTLAYGSTVRGGDQLLPGTTIATVPVGEASTDEAFDRVAAHLDAQLDRTITLAGADATWTTTPRELGATSDLDAAVQEAAGRADELGFADLVKLRWLGADDGLAVDVPVTVPEDEVAAFVAGVAEEVDRDPRDAEVTWADDTVAVTTEGRTGRVVERDQVVEALTAAATGDATDVDVVVTSTDPDVTTERAEEIAAEVGDAVDAALDRAVTVRLDERRESVTGRELGAVPDVAPLVAAALEGDGVEPDVVDLSVGDDAVAGVLDTVTSGTTVAARDASLDVSNGGFRITPEVVGAAVDRGEAAAQLRAALDGAADEVALELQPVRPGVTADDFDEVLVVDASTTTLTFYRNGTAARSWPVAVGTNNSPTPTGTFVVGAKRYEPTWVNPAKDRWGANMPDRIGPGPNNPLGARAINWNRPGGGDTLIRFHGTPNVDSIGSAASNGCVRMYDRDVIELYDLVSSGTLIISKV